MAPSNNERFCNVIGAILGIAPASVTDALSPETVDTWDSLNHINLMAGLEQEFGVLFNAAKLNESPSVARLRAALVECGVTL